MEATSHSFNDLMAALPAFTDAGVEVVALDTAGDDPPALDDPHPQTTGNIQHDQYRWVWPPPKGYSFGVASSHPMVIQVMVTTGKVQRSDWLGLEQVIQWRAEHPPIEG